jgi:transcription initiation factor IIE alpha subunit
MVANERLKLAACILKDTFGSIAQQVGESLINEGPSAFLEIMRNTGLNYVYVRDAILVLSNHGIVICYDKDEKERRVRQLAQEKAYEANPDSFSTRSSLPMSLDKEREQAEKNKRFKKNPNSAAAKSLFAQAEVAKEKSKEERENTVDTLFYYEILVEQVLVRLKTPKFIFLIQEKVDMMGEYIMEELLEHGRLDRELIIDRATRRSCINNNNNNDTRNDGGDLDFSFETSQRRKVELAFDEMVKNRYIKRVETNFVLDANGIVSPITKTKTGTNKDSTTSSSTLKQSKTLRETMEEKKQAEIEKEREMLDQKREQNKTKKNDRKEAEAEIEATDKQKKRKRKSDSSSSEPLKKRKKVLTDEELEREEPVEEEEEEEDDLFLNIATKDSELSNPKDNEIMWIVNFDQFIRTFRNEAITKYVLDIFKELSARVFEVILSLTSRYEKSNNDYQSAVVHFNEILQEVTNQDVQCGPRQLDRILDSMAGDPHRILTKMNSQSGGGSYVINLAFIAEKLKRQFAESIIEQKYGQIGCRIFRMLLMKKQLEQKQISEYAMIPLIEARTLLYKMLQDNIVEQQEVPRHGDRAPSRTFYLWNVKLHLVYESLVNNMYKTCRNIRTRLAKEQLEAFNVTGGTIVNSGAHLSQQQRTFVKRLEKCEDRLDTSMIHLNVLLMFFEDF